MANRTWAYFFGYGFIDPIDEPGDENQSIIPEVHEELAKAFLESKFDLRFLIRAITRSKAYQLSSRKTHESQSEPRTFSRMTLKGLTAEQIFDSLAVATVMSVTLTCDHRALDGAIGARWLQAFKALIEDPIMMII